MAIEWLTRSIDSAVDLTKQLITLATGVLTLTLTFYTNFFPQPANQPVEPSGLAKVLLALSWSLFVLSILAGLLTLSTITGAQAVSAAGGADTSVAAGNTRVFAMVQWVLFVVALGLITWAVISAL